MCCHRVISLLQSALLSPARRRVQDDASTVNDEHRPQQVQLITDENEDRSRGIDQFIDQPMHILLCPWHVAYANQRRRLSHTEPYISSVAQTRAGRRG